VRVALTALLVGLGCCCLPASVWAQGQTSRANGPFANLFGARPTATHALDFQGYLFGAYQELLLPPEELEVAELDPLFQRSQRFAGASGSLNYHYERQTDHAFFNVNGYGSVADYSIRPDVLQYSAAASTSAGLVGQLTPKIRYTTSVSASYSPFLGYSPFSPQAIGSVDTALVGPEFGFPRTLSHIVPVTATAQVTDQLSRRSSLTAMLGYSRLFVLDDSSNGSDSRIADVRYNRQVTRRLGAYAGYHYAEFRYSGSDNVGRSQGADFGVNYGDALTLPLGRRTTASFSGALTGAGATDPARPVSSTGTFYAATGSATLNHVIGRTWSATAAYNRSLGFSDLFNQPILADTATGTISGLLAQRVSWNSSVGWMRGQVGFGADASHLSASFASSTLTFAVFRTLGLYANYVYYRYEVPQGRYTRFNLPTHNARQIASVGLTAWVPIFHHNARSEP
jgi:hypothetical protein